jgi:hypothetical protein
MIVVLCKNGFGETRQYKCPEHGWVMPSPEAGIKAATQAIKQGALEAGVWQTTEATVERGTLPTHGTLLHSFERNAKGGATPKRH